MKKFNAAVLCRAHLNDSRQYAGGLGRGVIVRWGLGCTLWLSMQFCILSHTCICRYIIMFTSSFGNPSANEVFSEGGNVIFQLRSRICARNFA
jgi:hypothetical protein